MPNTSVYDNTFLDELALPQSPGEPLNPTNMSNSDIDALLDHYRGLKNQSSDISDKIRWLEHEQTYRQTQRAMASSASDYDDILKGAKSIDDADRAIIVDAIRNKKSHIVVSSEEEARRIVNTLDEMTHLQGGMVTKRPPIPSAPGQRPDLPFRGPEHHPFPDSGANRSPHFNTEIIVGGEKLNFHIYWSN